jgi:hypothetical protein
MYQLYTKLKSLKGVLKKKNAECYGDIQQKVLQPRVHCQDRGGLFQAKS